MKIIKVFNNNCVSTMLDDRETIVTGLGVGFQKKPGETIPVDCIEKTFRVYDENMSQFEQLINRYPVSYFELTRTIVEKATKELNVEINDQINISLTDHIAYAIERVKENIVMPSFTNDLQMFYPKEYEIGRWAIEYIKQQTGHQLPEEEAIYFAIHIVNASLKSSKHFASQSVFFFSRIIKIINTELGVTFEENTMAYNRLITHLKYLAHRILLDKQQDLLETDDNFFKQLKASLSKYRECIDKITLFCKHEYQYNLNSDEKMYLSIHLHQIMKHVKS